MLKLNYTKVIFLLSFISVTNLSAQNTVGIINNSANAFNGYTLFTQSTETYLINNCGEVVNQWSSTYPPGNAVYLLENGDLLRACRLDNDDIAIGGGGGRIERYDWDGTLNWSYNYSSSTVRQHHDIYPISNGNILMLAITIMSQIEAVEAGRDPANLVDSVLYNEQILELEPTGMTTANIIWEWNIKDHLVQDFDNTKDNFGVVADNPQLLDINYLGASSGKSNWLHFNSMQYYENLDQIVISSRLLSEFYIIDHSTSMAQASTNSGGTYGKGGDLLYRWGNPEAYAQGTSVDKKLFGQHFPHFIQDGLLDAGKIILFNNGAIRSPSFSEINILSPPTSSPGVYSYTAGSAYGPTSVDYIYTDPIDSTNFYSPILSSAQRLPNDNILICEGTSGRFFEIDSNEDIVWEYINPQDTNGMIFSQGETPSVNNTFRAIKYAPDYAAFTGRDLTPELPIELNPDLSNCSLLGNEAFKVSNVKIFPNPTLDILNIKAIETIDKIEVYSVLGKLITTNKNSNQIDLSHLSKGLYILKIYSNGYFLSKKIVKD